MTLRFRCASINFVGMAQKTQIRESIFVLDRWENVLPSLPPKQFDLIYTDPPFGIRYRNTIAGDKRWNQSGNTGSRFDAPMLGDHEGGVDWKSFAKHCFRTLKNDRWMFLHCNLAIIYKHLQEFVEAGFEVRGLCPWNKANCTGGHLSGALRRDWEPIVYLAKGRPKFHQSTLVIRHGMPERRARISELADFKFVLRKTEHVGFPTQKPLNLCKYIINLTTKIGDVICDPFAGSMSIPTAAHLLRRKYFAIEDDEKVFNKFKDRPAMTRFRALQNR